MPKSIPAIASAPEALGPYSIVTEAHGLVFMSGQVALNIDTGERETGASVTDQTQRIMGNITMMLGDLGLTTDDIVKTTIFLTDMGDYGAVNDVYASHVGPNPPARSAVAVAALPGGFSVEIEILAARP